MLKKDNRIRHDKDFDRAFKLGQSFYGENLGFKVVNNDLGINRLGILISTKVSKKAVIRNHFKRQIREIIRAEFPKLSTGHDLVIIVFPKILNKNFQQLEVLIRQALKNLNLYQ